MLKALFVALCCVAPLTVSAADLPARALTYAEDLVALRNERTAFGLQAEAIFRDDAAYDEAAAVLRVTRYALALAKIIEDGQVNLSIARRQLGGRELTRGEKLAYDEAFDPFLIDAVQFLQPELAETLLRAESLQPSAADRVIFDFLLSTLGTGGSYTIPVAAPTVAQVVEADGQLMEALEAVQRIAKALFEARANAPLGLKAFPERIPSQWQPFVGADSAGEREGASGLTTLGVVERDGYLAQLADIERGLDSWQPAGCHAAAKLEIKVALLSMMRALSVSAASIERLHNQLLTIDPDVPSLVLLERFNTADALQVSLDSQWLEAGKTLQQVIAGACEG